MKDQMAIIKKILLIQGYINRNWALRNYIGRLASRINDLKNEGWIIEGDPIKTERGTDYVYTLIKPPRYYDDSI